MDLRQRVLDLCHSSDSVIPDWITKQLEEFPIRPDQTPESYITARAKSINVTVEDPSESEPSQSPTSNAQQELDADPEAMAKTKQEGGAGRAAAIDGGVISSDDEHEVILIEEEEEDEDPIAGHDEDDVVLQRPERIARDEEQTESATTSRTNSSSPQPNPSPALPPPPPSSLSARPSSSSASQPTTISPSLLQKPPPPSSAAPQAKASFPRIQTLASSSSQSKSKSPSPAPDEAASPSSTTTPTATSHLPQSEYRPHLSDALIAKSPVAATNRLIALLAPPPPALQPFIPASDRSEILHAMNKSGNSRYYAAWVAHPDGMDVLAGWLKGLTAKESEPWRATAVVLLEVIKKMEVTKEILLDKKKKFTIARMLGKVVNNAALSEKVRSLAQSLVDSYSKLLGITPTASSSGGGNEEGSNKKRKVETSTSNGSSSTSKPSSSSTSTKPTTSSTLKPSSSSAAKLSSTSKPPSKLAASKPSGPAAKTDTSWFAKPAVAAPVKKAPTTSSSSSSTTATASSASSAPKPTASAPAASPSSSSSSSNVFQQALSLTGASSSTLGKRPISAVDGSGATTSGGKRKKTITWRDEIRPDRGLEDVRVFEKAGWEIQFEGTHDQTLAQLDKDEGRSMKGHGALGGGEAVDMSMMKDIEDEMVDWYEPRPLLVTPDMLQNIYPYTGLHASEQLAVTSGTLQTIYLSDSDIPDSPAEPDPSRIVQDGPETRFYEAIVNASPPPSAVVPLQPQQFFPPPPPTTAAAVPLGVGLAAMDLGSILSQLSRSVPPVPSSSSSSSSNAYAPPPPSSSYYPGIPPPNEYNPDYPPPSSSYGNNQYGQNQGPGPSSYNREGGNGNGPLPPQQQMHDSSFGGGGGGKRKGGDNSGGAGQRGGKKGRHQQHDGGGERPWGEGGGGGGRDYQQGERERNKKGPPCRFFASGRCAKGSTCEFRH